MMEVKINSFLNKSVSKVALLGRQDIIKKTFTRLIATVSLYLRPNDKASNLSKLVEVIIIWNDTLRMLQLR